MNILGKVLNRIVKDTEEKYQESVLADPYRQLYHFMPPVGWLNDPNGLCWFHGEYHVFYQYCPIDAHGGLKFWGHATTKDFIHWEQHPVMLHPDEPWNLHGVYSGSALIENDYMYLCYTGNVKFDGNFDYITKGREQNTVMAISENGFRVKKQQVLLRNIDYPEDVTLHVRDPKIWKEHDGYYLILGARNSKDYGEALIYRSENLTDWKLCNRITTQEPFGYMWECPDLVCLDGQYILFLSPQGVPHEDYRFQNKYSCGYFPLYGNFRNDYTLGDYQELDYGFDFYAQQTFTVPDGRTLAMTWMGMPDAPYTNPTAETHNWQHCMTIVRQLTWDGTHVQSHPADEYQTIYTSLAEYDTDSLPMTMLEPGTRLFYINNGGFLSLKLNNELEFSWNGKTAELILGENAGAGRTKRSVKLDHLDNLEIFLDTSSIEIFINDGTCSMSSRFYPETSLSLTFNGSGHLNICKLSGES